MTLRASGFQSRSLARSSPRLPGLNGRSSDGQRPPARSAVLERKILPVLLGCALSASVALAVDAGISPRKPATATKAQTGDPESGNVDPLEQKTTVKVFFQDGHTGRLVAEEREIFNLKSRVGRAKQAIGVLLAGPDGEDLVPLFPADVKLRALFIDAGGDAYVDLSSEVERPTGVAEEMRGIAAIARTLAVNFPVVKRFRLLIDGREADTLRGHISIAYPFLTDCGAYRPSPGDGAP